MNEDTTVKLDSADDKLNFLLCLAIAICFPDLLFDRQDGDITFS
jgi:hypothetical protein